MKDKQFFGNTQKELKRISLLMMLVVVSALSFAQPKDSLVHAANELYAQGNYASAAKQYEAIIAENSVAPEIYYNLGNAYYKMNETGRSILNYERALRLSPNYADAKHNLELAKLKIVDNIPQHESFFLLRWLENFIKLFSSNQWLFVSGGLFVLALLLVFVFMFGSSHGMRKSSFYLAVILFLISLLFFVFSGIRKNQFEKRDSAVVMVGVVVVKSSPDKRGTDLFQLHEGTKIKIKSSLSEWTEVEVGNGNIGWLESVNIEKI